ncbi:TetR family transcriptional regulator [Nibricoccus aquaticus]|uniref:TetR family transcriptional regulator n=1 Tax=Nibricoccus aquaticus TaxID=2576891 RepID=A0A290Q7E6_9BACT|nr:TetR/AcrR family transcriptional regulator [Nibricoccus aquaticus]ATC64625.1 TetR family transcriptional regulator [Nibricoccus aquaticus]
MPRKLAAKPTEEVPVRDRLLRAATTLFARAGLDGTTVDEIVETAEVNKRMVYHYFGNKEQLYQEVLTEAYRGLEVLEINTLSHNQDIEAMTAEIVRMYFNFLRDHPEFVRLLLWENLNDGRGLAGAGFKLSKDPMLGALNTFLQSGIAAGKIRNDMDARHLLISLIGLCLIYSSNRYTLSKALSLDLASPKVREDGIRHVTRLLLEGIKAAAS